MFLQHSRALREHSVTITSPPACQLLQHFRVYLSCRHLVWAIVSAEVYPVLLFPSEFPHVFHGDFLSMSRGRWCVKLKGDREALISMLIILALMLEAQWHRSSPTLYPCSKSMCALQQASRWLLLERGMLGNYTLRKPLQVFAAKSGLSGSGWRVVGAPAAVKVFPMTAATKGSQEQWGF